MSTERTNLLFTDLFGPSKKKRSPLLETLAQNTLFSGLTRRELRYLSQFVYERSYQPGEPVFRQDERGIGMYLIAKGKVTIRARGHKKDHVVTHLGAGSFFGELALVDPEHLRSAEVIAAEASLLIGFFKPDLMDIVERKPEMGARILMALSKVLGGRLIETTERLTELQKLQEKTGGNE